MAEEEGALGIAGFDDLRNFFQELLGTLSLLVEVLSLEKLVEGRNDFTINLSQSASNVLLGNKLTYVISPEPGICPSLRTV
jgi:hypothetical protein